MPTNFDPNNAPQGSTAAHIAQPFERPPTPAPAQALLEAIGTIKNLLGGIEVAITQPLRPEHGGALAAVMMVKAEQAKIALDDTGTRIIGLNLVGLGINDAQWAKITKTLPNGGADLQALNLSANELTVFDAGPFAYLEKLRLTDNKIRTFSLPRGRARRLEDLDLGGNVLEGVPPELDLSNRHAVLDYFKEIDQADSDKIWEAKLVLVGDGGAGKTTLAKKLKDPDFKVPFEEPSTKGVETRIEHYTFKGDEGQDIKVNVWDFAGQEKYQAIHQFFYTHRALYVLLENAREQKTDFDFWFQTVELFSKCSPMLVVHNEFVEQNRGPFDLKAYQKNYPGWLKDNVRVDFKTNRGLADLEKKIRLEILGLPHIGTELPKTWLRVREALGLLCKTKPYIPWQDFLDICAKNGMDDPDYKEAERRARRLSDYLHVLGVMLHYAEHPELKQWVILQNEWATNVYRILDDEKIVYSEPRGHFQFEDIERLWHTREYGGMHARLRDLMIEFKICYKVHNRDLFVAPSLLPADPPEGYLWPNGEEMRLRLEYEFMPRGLLTHFTVDQHSDIAEGQLLVWRSGVVLEWEKNRAEVREKYQVNNGYIEIKVQGPERKSFLQQLDRGLDRVHETFPGLQDKVKKLVPCDCELCSTIGQEPHFFEYKELREFVADNIFEDRCRKSRKMMDIRKLINDYFSEDKMHHFGKGIEGSSTERSAGFEKFSPGPANEEVVMRPDARGYTPFSEIKGKVNLLFLAATPKHLAALNTGKESRFKDLISHFDEYRRFHIVEEHGITKEHFQSFILQRKPHILHYAGHGDKEGVLLEDGMLEESDLSDILELSAITQCVVLNACHTLEIGRTLARHIPFVIATRGAIPDETAIAFARGFYQALVVDQTIEIAFKAGLAAIKREKIGKAEVLVLLKGVKA